MYKMLIVVATYNRPYITELSLAMLREVMGSDDRLIAYDDCSTAYDKKWLLRFADEVVRMPAHGGIEPLRARNFKDFVQVFREFDLLYTTDNDAIHDPVFSRRLRGLYGRYAPNGVRLPVCLYNSSFHNQPENILSRNAEVSFRRTAPGISHMYDQEMVQLIVDGLSMNPELETMYDYDFNLPRFLRRPFIQSEVSLVEHFARDRYEGGMHSENSGVEKETVAADFERDRALNPSHYLELIRPVVIDYILEGTPETAALAA